jgi:hypothetical protein
MRLKGFFRRLARVRARAPDLKNPEVSAGASFLRRDGGAWTTDKDGPIMNLLAAEITARTGKDPGEHYHALIAEFGTAYYTRIDAAATPERKARLGRLSPEAVKASNLAGEPIIAKLSRAPGEQRPDRWSQGRNPQRLVRSAPVRHRSRLQDLRRKLQGRATPAGDRNRRPADRQ